VDAPEAVFLKRNVGVYLSDIRADLSQYYATKVMFERILGRGAFLRVKDYGPLSSWRANYIRLLQAIGVAVDATVEVADVEWKQEVKSLLARGVERLTSAMSIDELHAAAAATLGELALLQLGFIPRGHYRLETVPLTARNWKLNPVRTVQYVQSAKQRATQKRLLRSR
jgi:hypothetical protein